MAQKLRFELAGETPEDAVKVLQARLSTADGDLNLEVYDAVTEEWITLLYINDNGGAVYRYGLDEPVLTRLGLRSDRGRIAVIN